MENLPLDLSFSVPALIAALLFGVVGFWLYREGKRRDQSKVLWIGVALMIYPYFVEGAFWTWTIGLILCALARHYWWG